ncbi:MAG: transcription elongation factor GreA [Candidatus Blackburnbacteria bacterium]|nr:transcription elongation factor GreA [Candidatus Blackburnbacteria bacterium]
MNKLKGIQITREGYERLKKELDELVNKKRPLAVDRLSHARSMGDLAENNDYHQAKEALEFIDGKISELESVIGQAVVIRSNSGKRAAVEVGAKVKVGINGNQQTFHIVGEWEADPKEKKISHESPLGKALVGRRVGEKVMVEAPVGSVEYTILEIE